MKRATTIACASAALLLAGATVAIAEDAKQGIWAPYVPGDVEAEIIAQLPQAVGNIGFTPGGDIIFSHHPFYGPDVKVAKLGEDGTSFTPFPNAEWNQPKDGSDEYLDTVIGIRGDTQGIIWISDMMHGARQVPKLVGWNTNTDSLEVVLRIPEPATLPCNADSCASQLNDFAIDEKRGKFYFADENIGPGGDASRAAIVVLDRETGNARRVLEGHWSTLPADVPVVVDGQPLTLPLGAEGAHIPLLVGVDGITIDLADEWVYFSPLNGGWIYRVRADDLVDETLSEEDLGARVEKYAVKPNNGGISIDADNNLYTTAFDSTYVGVIPPDTRRFRPFASHPDMQVPDGVSYGPDGHMYVAASQLAQLPLFNDGENYTGAPFLIYRFKPLAESKLGR